MAKEPVNRTVYFLLPVFNEAENLPLLHSSIAASLPDHKKRFVFVDDGSSDGTAGVVNSLFLKEDHVILGDGRNHGPGFAFNTGFEWIIGNSSGPDDLIVTLESDNTSDPELLPKLISISSMGYDLVLASVYAQGGGFDKTSFLRKFISFFANILLRFIFDIKVLTLSSFYRVYSISLIKKIKEKHGVIISEQGFISMIEILIKAVRLDATVIEVPMKLFSKRRKGKSKMKVLKEFSSYLRFFLKNI